MSSVAPPEQCVTSDTQPWQSSAANRRSLASTHERCNSSTNILANAPRARFVAVWERSILRPRREFRAGGRYGGRRTWTTTWPA